MALEGKYLHIQDALDFFTSMELCMGTSINDVLRFSAIFDRPT